MCNSFPHPLTPHPPSSMVRGMTRTRAKDPEEVIVQLQIRVPWWRRVEFEDLADERGVSIAELIVATMNKTYPPKRRS